MRVTLAVMMEKSRMRRRIYTLVLVCLSQAAGSSLLASDGDKGPLDVARRDYALHFLSAEAHVGFAKALYDKGERLQAFFVLETARRQHFSQAEFDEAYRKIFRSESFDNGAERESTLRTARRKNPNEYDGLTKFAAVYISHRELVRYTPL